MGIFDSFTRKREFLLLDRPIRAGDKAAPLGVTQSETNDNRVSKEQLQAAYKKPLIFNSINKITQIIMSTGYRLEGDPKSIEFFEDYLEMVGKRGGTSSWYSMQKKIFLFNFIYGFCPVEKIFNEQGDYIVDIDIINPVTFDYAKTPGNNIAMDTYGNAIGYVQNLPKFSEIIGTNKFPAPEYIKLDRNQIYIPRDRVALFKLYEIGEGFYGIGLIEPIYSTIQRHEAAEQSFINSCYRVGSPLIDVIVGDENHEPTEEQIQNAVNTAKDSLSRDVFAHGYWTKIGLIEPKNIENMKTFLDYFIDMEITGMGIAEAFAMGSGEATNRATLGRQEYVMKLSLKDIIKKFTDTIENGIFYDIAQKHNAKYPNSPIKPVKMVWNELALEELDAKAERLLKYANGGYMTPTVEIKDWIKNIENLPVGDTPLVDNSKPDKTPEPVEEVPKKEPEKKIQKKKAYKIKQLSDNEMVVEDAS